MPEDDQYDRSMRYVLRKVIKFYFLLMAARKSILNNGKFDDLGILSHFHNIRKIMCGIGG